MREGLTYNDVLLVPKRTPLSSRGEADVEDKLIDELFINVLGWGKDAISSGG